MCLAWVVVSSEWNVTDNSRAGSRVCLVDKRMVRHEEDTLGSNKTSAVKMR